jgi:hypothetical protein
MNVLVAIISALTLLMVVRMFLDAVGPLPRRSERTPRTRDWR